MATTRTLLAMVRKPKEQHIKLMKPTPTRSLLAQVAAVALALMAGMTARADYPSTVLGDGPLTYLRFSETTVVPTPYPMATNLGTLGTAFNGSDAVAQDPGIVRGVPGVLPGDTAYDFPGGTNTAVVIPYNAVLAQNAAFSVEFWANPNYPWTSMSAWGTATAFIDYNSPRRGWLIYQSDSTLTYGNGWIFRLYRNSSTTLLADAEIQMPVNANVWYHIVCVWDGTNAKIYTNGVQAVSVVKLTGTYTAASSARALTIGSRGNSGSAAVYEYNGVIDEYAYYTNALSASVIAAHYAAVTTNAAGYAAQILTSKPAGYWRLNEQFNPTTVANLGTGGSAFNGTYRQGATTAADTYGAIDTGNRVLLLATNNPGYVNIPPFYLNSVNAATIECWVKRNGVQSASAGVVFYREPSVTSFAFPNCGGLCFATGTTLGYNWNNSSLWDSGLTPPDGQWVYVALSISPSQAVLCMYDGTTWSAATNTTAIGGMSMYWNMDVGWDSTSTSRYFNGSIDEVAFYPTTLTSDQLRGHALAGFGNTSPPVFLIDPPLLAPKGTIYAGWPFSLSVDAYGVPPLSYQWRKNGTAIPNATSTTYSVTSAAGSDTGNYDVVVTNPNGSTTNTTATAVTVVTTAPDVTSGLLTWLRFDETSGMTAYDSSGHGRNGALQNFYNDPAQWVPGLINNALSVNPDYYGEQQVVVVSNADSAFDFSSGLQFTLSAWVYGNPASQGANGGIIARGYGNGGEQYSMDMDSGHFRFFVRNASATPTVINSSIAPNGAWQHVCAVYSASFGVMNLYINGALAGSATPPTSLLVTNHDLSVGARQSVNSDGAAYDDDWVGLVDDARVYGRALVPAEVQALYNAAPTIAPTIAQDPVGRSVFAGGSVTLTSVALGTLPMKYQWYNGAISVTGATAATLTITNVNSGNVGAYSLRVTNGGGYTNSAAATVALLPALANTYESLVVADAPEAYWRLNETYDGTGVIFDSMGRHDGATRSWGGTVDGGAGFNYGQTGALADNADPCIQFQNAYQNLITVPYSAALNSIPFSYECWANLSSLPVSPLYYATYSSVASSTSGTVNRGSAVYALAQNGDWEDWYYENGTWGVGHGSPLAVSQWVHLVATYDGQWQSLYVNGTLVSSLPTTFYPNTSNPFHIGSSRSDSNAGDMWFDGLLDEVAWYRTALSPGRIEAHYGMGAYGTNSLPVCIQPPASQTVTVGATATFTAAVIGAPTITCQWQKDGVDIPGATGWTLSVPNVYYTDGGHQYAMAATNGIGGTISLPATLTVMPPASQTNLVFRAKAGTSGSGAIMELIWPAGTLYSAPEVNGPWTAVSGATLPYYTISPTNAAMFFRRE
jgi:hypothetical protein